MKMKFLKPIATFAVVAVTMFSCAGTNEGTGVAAVEDDEYTETEYASEEIVQEDTELVANEEVTSVYDDVYDNIDETDQYTIMQLMQMNPNLTTFVELINLAGLAPSIEAVGPVTIFAPTNEAFAKLPSDRIDYLKDPLNRADLVKLVELHLVPEEFSTMALDESNFIDRGEEEDIPVNTTMDGTVIYIGGAQIVTPDVEASNGVLHVVNNLVDTSDEAGADID